MRIATLLAALPAIVLSTAATISCVGAEPATKPTKVAAAAKSKPAVATTTLVARVNLSAQRLDVSYDGAVQHSWPISSGREGYATPRGTYRPQWTSRMWYSKKYDDAPMPHSVFFVGGVAIHGTQSVGMLGSPASHGCVRLAPGNAATFYGLVQKHGLRKTRIEVFGTPPPSRVAKRRNAEPAGRVASSSRSGRKPAVASSAGWSWSWGWAQSTQQPPAGRRGAQSGLRRGANGLYYLPPGNANRGKSSFVYNGVRYIRVR